MSVEISAALAREVAHRANKPQVATGGWIETALAVLFTAAAVVSASCLAVATGLV
jgi:hypothetical protein